MEYIYANDSMPLVVSWFAPDVDNPYQSDDAVISQAHVMVIRNKDRHVVVDNASALIEDNETKYTVPSELTTATGAHTAYVTAEFNDGTKLTKAIEFYIRQK